MLEVLEALWAVTWALRYRGLEIVGYVMITYGVSLMHEPIAWIVGGALTVNLALRAP